MSATTTVPGIYKFKATAIDDKGASTSTAEVAVTSGTPTQLNRKPTVSLSLSNTLVMAPATVTLTATASDTDGAIQKVQFYRNGAKIGEKTATPFTFTDTIAASGKVSYHVDATDDVGNVNATLQQVVSAQVGCRQLTRRSLARQRQHLGQQTGSLARRHGGQQRQPLVLRRSPDRG